MGGGGGRGTTDERRHIKALTAELHTLRQRLAAAPICRPASDAPGALGAEDDDRPTAGTTAQLSRDSGPVVGGRAQMDAISAASSTARKQLQRQAMGHMGSSTKSKSASARKRRPR